MKYVININSNVSTEDLASAAQELVLTSMASGHMVSDGHAGGQFSQVEGFKGQMQGFVFNNKNFFEVC